MRDDRVGDHRRQPPVDERVLPILAPAAHDVEVPLLQHLDHRGNVGRIVLVVAVQRDDVAAAGVLEARRKGGGLPEVAAEANHPDARILRLDARQQLERVVAAPIVNRDDLVRAAELGQARRQLAVEAPRCSGTRSASGRQWISLAPCDGKRLIIRAFACARQSTPRRPPGPAPQAPAPPAWHGRSGTHLAASP